MIKLSTNKKSNENKTINSNSLLKNEGAHDESLWHIDSSLSTVVDEDCVTIIKKNGISDEQILFPKLTLKDNFEISMDVKAINGTYITFILNTSPHYGGTITGWREMPDWTSLRIKRTNDIIEVYYGNPKKPQAIYKNQINNLYFLIRFIGLEDENKLYFKNFTIFENNQIKFLDIGVKNDFEYILREVSTTKERMYEVTDKLNQIEKIIEPYDSLKNLMKFLSNDAEIKPKKNVKLIQNISEELLKFIVNICEKKDYTYWLDNSTLLGAVRHEGFIPWDYEISLGLLRFDFNKVITDIKKEAILTNIRENLIITIDELTENDEIRTYIKVKYCDNEGNILSSANIYAYDFLINFNETIIEKYNNEIQSFQKNILNGETRRNAEKILYEKLELSKNKKDFIIQGVDGITEKQETQVHIWNTSDIIPTTLKKFNGEKFKCPNNYDKYLTIKYGEYYNPKINYDEELFQMLRNKQNSEEYLEKYLILLRDVNDL
ncbi:MAG: LicD family protein [Methanosphaera sp.]|nr:LicD family protein [Methanosphaera sp.]